VAKGKLLIYGKKDIVYYPDPGIITLVILLPIISQCVTNPLTKPFIAEQAV
jgi:hypothetical protein